MKVEEFQKVLEKSLRIIEIGIKKGDFKEEDKKVLTDKLLKVLKNKIVKDKTNKNSQKILIYIHKYSKILP